MHSRAPGCERAGALVLASDGIQGVVATGQFDEAHRLVPQIDLGWYTAYMSESAEKTTVDTSLFEQVAEALVIVGKAELAEIEEVLEEVRGGREGAASSGA